MLDSKLHPPYLRKDLVEREELLRRVRGADTGLVVVAAPAGYGKTTLLAQYASSSWRPFAWLSLDSADSDPVLLLLELAETLGRVAPVDPHVGRALRASEPAIERVVLPGLLNSLRSRPGTALVLDDLHLVESPESLAVVAFLCEHVRDDAQLIVASRDASSLPLARLRVSGSLLELGPRDLALRRGQANDLLLASGVALEHDELDVILDRTEGWPAGLHLAALALRDAPDRGGAATGLAGGDRDLVDYLSDELLSRQPPERLSFLLRSSVLTYFSAPLCDAVLQIGDSATMIAELEDANLFLLPLDRTREWYRYHHLFRDVLRAELDHREPDAATSLHCRASEWHERFGTPEEAVHHGLASRDMDRAGDLVVGNSRALVNTGRHATARRWIEAFTDDEMAGHAPLALTAAIVVALLGEKEPARRYMAIAERAPWRGLGALGESSGEAGLALLRAMFGWEGVTSMKANALAAYRLEPLGRPAHGPAAMVLGCSMVMLGRTEEGRPFLEGVAALGTTRASLSLIALGQLVQIALDDGRSRDAETLAREGTMIIDGLGLAEHTSAACVHTAIACLGAGSGDVGRARTALDQALPLLTRVSAFPWWSIQTGALLGRVALAVGDLELAGALLAGARRELARYPDAGVLPRLLAREERALSEVRGGRGVLSQPLTDAELRVLAVLPTHLSLEGIGGALHISRHTVKSHLSSIYRKLGATGRSDAVDRARRLGLLGRGD